ncbi:uncharacterized protein N7479_007337 [Penicillium vulpinum]|uniref:Uncharacterized protein n=1 Tax=Penicillium vulpinum TaxID=29845 RepID=A0A1V6S167_9EURO|nr:uncharacterized protein N7479_007337 [Penicillium vulpinum]KAJ5960187.1 hypothetical protein N7479_007337 [Penicillium vulpinum]OQE07608.1 hypothetical protein PENVUL_c013G03738 [Penicillium vulpinum]
MRNFIALAAFTAGSNALVSRGDSCCFHLTSSGGASGQLGQLGDGQNRIGDNTLQPAQYCIDSSGSITDSKGRGCILTPPTTQLQCDEGVGPTPGFSVNSQGKLEYNNSPNFVACATGQNGGLNVYTTPNKLDVTGCVNVELSADACSNSGTSSGGSSSAGGVPHPSSAPPVPAPQSTPAGSAPGPQPTPSGGAGGAGPGPVGPGAGGGAPGGGGPGPVGPGAGGSAPAPSGSCLPGSPSTVVVTVTDCSCPTSGAPGAPGAPGGGAGGGGPQPSASVPAPSGGAGIKPSGTQPAPGGGGGAQPGPSLSAPAPGGGGGASQSGPSPSAPAPGGGGGASQPGPSASAPAPSGGGGGSSQPSASASVSPPSGGGGGGISVSVPAFSSGGGPQPTGSATGSVPASSTSSKPSATGPSGGACPTDLSGNYEIPHLVIPVDTSSPGTAAGTSFNGTVSSTISTVFNFDIPSSDAGKTCSLIFLFPKLEDLETSSYSFSGDGKIDFSKLSATADSSTNANNVPSVSQDLGTITVAPGNSYLVSTFSCPAGQAVAYQMKNAGSTNLNFFEDWNPSPLGLYITTC